MTRHQSLRPQARDWKQDCIEHLSTSTSGEARYLAALQLRDKHLPKLLYRYRYLDPEQSDHFLRTKQSLQSLSAWMSTPDQFNDPYDSSFILDSDFYANEYCRRELPAVVKNTGMESAFTEADLAKIRSSGTPFHTLIGLSYKKLGETLPPDFPHGLVGLSNRTLGPDFAKLIAEAREALRVCCFSETMASVLMWSHYANQHKGFCLEYQTTELIQTANPTDLLLPVWYSEAQIDLSAHLLPPVKQTLCTAAAACCKARDWSYESEWRLLRSKGNPSRAVQLPKPRRIILGSKSDSLLSETLRSIPALKQVPQVKARLSTTDFKIEV